MIIDPENLHQVNADKADQKIIINIRKHIIMVNQVELISLKHQKD